MIRTYTALCDAVINCLQGNRSHDFVLLLKSWSTDVSSGPN